MLNNQNVKPFLNTKIKLDFILWYKLRKKIKLFKKKLIFNYKNMLKNINYKYLIVNIYNLILLKKNLSYNKKYNKLEISITKYILCIYKLIMNQKIYKQKNKILLYFFLKCFFLKKQSIRNLKYFINNNKKLFQFILRNKKLLNFIKQIKGLKTNKFIYKKTISFQIKIKKNNIFVTLLNEQNKTISFYSTGMKKFYPLKLLRKKKWKQSPQIINNVLEVIINDFSKYSFNTLKITLINDFPNTIYSQLLNNLYKKFRRYYKKNYKKMFLNPLIEYNIKYKMPFGGCKISRSRRNIGRVLYMKKDVRPNIISKYENIIRKKNFH